MPVQQTIRNVKLFVERNEPSSPDDAFKSCLQRSSGISLPYVVYRWIQFVLHWIIALGAVLDHPRTWSPKYKAPHNLEHRGPMFYAKCFLYLTNWGCCLNVLQSLTGAIVLSTGYNNSMSPGGELTIYGVSRQTAELYCNMFRTALLLSIYITCGFWILVWNPDIFALDVVMYTVHGGGTVLMLLDLFVVQFAYTMKTVTHIFVIVFVYAWVTLVHYWTGSLDRYQDKPYLYEVQDWSKTWKATLNTVLSFFSLGALHLVVWGLYQVRRRLFQTDRQSQQVVNQH